MQPTHKYLSNLTSLRGIAAIWVFLFHFQGRVVQFVSPEQTQLVSRGYLMVDLFFIMSGFIICHVYQESFQSGITYVKFRRFVVARFARVYPLHLFTLFFLIILVAFAKAWNMIFDPKQIPANLLLLHSLGVNKVFTWNVPSWSISSEWWAYMVFPLLVLFIYRKKSLAIAILGLFAVTVYFALMFWLPRHDPFNPAAIVPHNLDTTFDYGYLRGLAGFSSGMLLYKMYETRVGYQIFQKDFTACIIMLITLLCMHIGINDGFYIILFVLLVYAFSWNNGYLHRICNSRLAQYLGKISYSIYLSSLLIFIWFLFGLIKLPGIKDAGKSATTNFWTGFAYFLLILLIHIGISSLTYFGIEKPFRKYINRRWGKETMPVYA